MKEFKEKLKAFGFSDKEARVYVALFELGAAAVSDVARRANINRSTAYVVLDMLAKRGLVSSTERRGVRLYNAVSPEKLIEHFEKTAQEYAALAKAVKKMAPELKSFQKAGKVSGARPKVQLYEGAEGMKTVYDEMLFSLEGIRAGNLSRGEIKTSPVSADVVGSVPQIAVQGSKIILVSPGEQFATVVESKELADKLKGILKSANKESKAGLFFKPMRMR